MVKALSGYKTSDGEVFDKKQDAEEHEAIVKAKQAFDDAREKLKRAVAVKYRTADGEKFEFAMFGDYFYIGNEYWGEPHIERVSFYIWRTTVAIEGEPSLYIVDDEGKQKEYELSKLYMHEKNAKKVLLEIKRDRLKQIQEEIAALEKGA